MDPAKDFVPSTEDAEAHDYVVLKGVAATPKQSHVCCGCCCDTRRAVIVVNIISLSFATLAILSIAMMSSERYAANFDDDEVLAVLSELDGAAVGMTIGYAALGMLFNVLGIFGAMKFQPLAVLMAGIWYFVDIIRSVLFFDLVSAIIAGCFAYPHIVLFQEIRKGVIGRENYTAEQQCCTCC